MTARRPCPPAPGPLEDYAARFDDLFFSLAQRRGFREYLTGLLAPRERNKTITCLAGAEPVAGAGMPGVQRLQFFLSESPWEAEQVNDRRLELLREESATAPHDGGVIAIDDSGDRKDGTATAHVGRQWLGRLPSPFRPRHPPPPDPGQLRLLLLLGPVVRPTRTPGCHRAGPLPQPGDREGAQSHPTSTNRPAGPRPYVPSGPGSPQPSPSPDGGEPGRTQTHPPSSRP
ncbi:transposase [Streptomyces mirabilis]|uniref:transposase n=1 Tax=Streptomyces mirabilis TaxID=68239 RepID=UPI0036F136B8